MQKKSMSRHSKWIAWVLCVSILLAICVPVIVLIRDMGKGIVRPTRVKADTTYRGWITVPQEDTVAAAQIS